MPQLSIVTSVYRTAAYLEDFARRAGAAAESCGLADYEMIFVIDGSPDQAIEVLTRIKAANPRVRVIDLSRNFGHHPALWCGMEAARGELVFLADSDCETPPEALAELHRLLESASADVAFATRRARKEAAVLRWLSRAFWRVFSMLAEVDVPPDLLTERLMRRRYVDALLSLQERNLFLAGAMAWVGFRQVPVPVERVLRDGPPSYSLRKRAALAVDALTSFSNVPMRLLFAVGVSLAILALCAALSLIILKLARPETVVQGFAAVAVLLLFSLGSILAACGLLGLYLGKVFLEAKARPRYVVRREF